MIQRLLSKKEKRYSRLISLSSGVLFAGFLIGVIACTGLNPANRSALFEAVQDFFAPLQPVCCRGRTVLALLLERGDLHLTFFTFGQLGCRPPLYYGVAVYPRFFPWLCRKFNAPKCAGAPWLLLSLSGAFPP